MSPTATTIIHSARLITGTTSASDAWVRFDGDRVTARGTGATWSNGSDPHDTLIDAADRILVPGFIDLHCHGGGGFAVEDGATAISAILATHRAHGTTRSILSLVSAARGDLIRRLEMIAAIAAADPCVLGAHLEGPFLDQAFRGAHDPAMLREADIETIESMLTASGGALRQVTIAPELPGAPAAIARLVRADVAVAVGHTGADFTAALRAFDAGASLLTHAFNGMRGIHHRAPGPIAAAMRRPHVTLEIINDGVHVDPAVVSLAFSCGPDRVALITDAMAAAGAGDGTYRLGSVDVVVREGVARMVDGDSIAGSTLTQDAALRRAVRECGIPLDQAVRALTSVPAAAIGRADDLGRLDPGYAADAVLLTRDFEVDAVWAAGVRQTADREDGSNHGSL